MKSIDKTKEQLLKEIELLNTKITKLEKSEAMYKKAEVTSRDSEKQFKFVSENLQEGLWITDNKDRMIYFNKRMEEISGVTKKDVIGLSVVQDFPKETTQHFLPYYRKAKKELKPTFYEANVLTPVGRSTIQSGWLIPKNKDKKYDGMVCTIEDITERKQTEEKLQKSEQRLSKAQEVANIGSWEMDFTTNESVWSDQTYRLFGLEPQEFKMIFERFIDFLHPEDRETMLSEVREAMANKDSYEAVYRIVRSDSEVRFMHSIAEIEHDESGKPVLISGTIQDITERKRVEEVLRESEEKYKRLVEGFPGIVYIYSSISGALFWSSRVKQILGFHPTELIETPFLWLDSIHKDDRLKIDEVIKEANTRKNFDIEYRIKDIRGHQHWFHDRSISCKIIGEEMIIEGLATDITERKQAEEALYESENRYRAIAEDAPVMLCRFLPGGKITYVNNKYCKHFEKIPEEVLGESFYQLVPEMEREKVKNDINSLNIISPIQTHEYQIIAPNGQIRWQRWTNRAMFTDDGNIVAYQSVGADITKRRGAEEKIKANSLELGKQFKKSEEQRIATLSVLSDLNETTKELQVEINERKQAEEALQENEERLSGFMESATDGFVLYDSKMNLIEINKKAMEIFPAGSRKENFVGKNVLDLFPGLVEMGRYKKYLKVIETGKPLIFDDFETKTKFGKRDLSIKAFKVGEGLGIISTDVTERKQAEKRLRESRNQLRSLAERLQMIREEERATVAREIHDDLGQTLTALKMDLSWMKKNPWMIEKMRSAKFDTMLDLTNSTIQTVKRIATELRPGILDDLGLFPAIEWEAEEFRKRSGIECNLLLSIEEFAIEEEISIAVFRIFQESLTNIARHSGATKITVTIKRTGDLLHMEITDNGVGISEEQISSSKSLGLIGMNERVSVFRGKLTISRAVEGGTSVSVRIPIIKSG
ncbi:MAG: PAS domain S-box protein [Ignavibacteriaceae bacterium]